MLSEKFMGICFELIFAKKPIELDVRVYQDIAFCMDFFEKEGYEGEIPLFVRGKYDLLKMVSREVAKGVSLAEILASISASQKYQHSLDYLETLDKTFLSESMVYGHLKALKQMVAWMKISSNHKNWKDYFEKVSMGCIETLEETTAEYIELVKSSFNEIMEFEIKWNMGPVSSLNTPYDDCGRIVNEVRKKYSSKNVIPSGIRELDREYLFGGFQPSRVYLFGGISGVGKSILLLNLAVRGAMSGVPKELFYAHLPTVGPELERLFLYVTLENYVYETWMRLYCCLTKKTKAEVLPGLLNGSIRAEEVRQEMAKILSPYNCSIQVEYFPSNSISPMNIAALIKKYSQSSYRRAVKAVYLDYLDLLNPEDKHEFYRLDLGAITSHLKTIAASFEIPIITATQLNREAYKKEKNKKLGMETISESIQKIFIADFGAIIQRVKNASEKNHPKESSGPIRSILKVEKNRDGKTGQVDLYFDYPRSRILTAEEYHEELGSIL